MTCLNLSNGFFVPTNWSTAPETNMGQTTVSRSNNQIVVTRTGLTGSFNAFGDFLYAVFGDQNFVAVLNRNSAGNTITWTVSIVDFSGNSVGGTLLFSVNLPSTHFPPNLATSPGNGRLAFFYSGTGVQDTVSNLLIVRSIDGDVVLGGAGTISNLNSNVTAQITATDLIINHPTTGSNDSTQGPRPAGSLSISPDPLDFGEAIIGGANAALATITQTFTLLNSGDDCVNVTAIQNDGVFTVAPGSLALLPIELDPGETAMINVDFTPGAPGNNQDGTLPVTATPSNGDTALNCEGDARLAQAEVSVSRSSINFGTLPHPSAAQEIFSISNTGELNEQVTIAGATSPSFNWAPVGLMNLPVGGAPIEVTVDFTTPGDTTATPDTVTVTPSQADPRSVSLSGAGCIANAVPSLPPTAPLVFGEVEAGFRMVRFVTVTNLGDGDLTFGARITQSGGADHTALFGLVVPNTDITDAPGNRTYTVPPVTRCGPGATGSGEVIVAVAFHADDAPDAAPYTANLEIDDPIAMTTSVYPLSGTITPAVPVDAVLVLDKSGSMSDPSGSRSKLEAAQSSGLLFSQLLRDAAEDRAALVPFDNLPTTAVGLDLISNNRAALLGSFGSLTAGGATNIAGGVITADEDLDTVAHPSSPPDVKQAIIVLTDGNENRCFQRGGAGDWFSITGNDAADGMFRPDLTPQDTDPLALQSGASIYAIGLGDPSNLDVAALDDIAQTTGGHFDLVSDLTGADYFQLEKYFTQIFMETADLAVISDPFYTINPGDKHVHEFDIFPGDVNTMIVLYDTPQHRLPFMLQSPLNEMISSASLPPGFGLRYRSSPTARFVEVTFPRGEPKRYAGRWKAIVLHEGFTCAGDINPRRDEKEGRDDRDETRGFLPKKCRDAKDPVDYGIAIGAGSNLRMQAFVEPGTKTTGDPIRLNAVLAEAGLAVTNASVKVTVTAPNGTTASLGLHDSGLNDDGAAMDGDYGGTFKATNLAGTYQFSFRAEGHQAGKPYVREAFRSKYVFDSRRPPKRPTDDRCDDLIRILRECMKKESQAPKKRG